MKWLYMCGLGFKVRVQVGKSLVPTQPIRKTMPALGGRDNNRRIMSASVTWTFQEKETRNHLTSHHKFPLLTTPSAKVTMVTHKYTLDRVGTNLWVGV